MAWGVLYFPQRAIRQTEVYFLKIYYQSVLFKNVGFREDPNFLDQNIILILKKSTNIEVCFLLVFPLFFSPSITSKTWDILVAGQIMIYDIMINNIFFPVKLCCEPNHLLLDESEVVLRPTARISSFSFYWPSGKHLFFFFQIS